jgi:MFS family permease
MAALLQVASSPGQTFGVSVFNSPIREALNLSLSQLTGCYLLASLLAAAPMPLVGWFADRVGLRRTGLAVLLLLGLACATISRAAGLITLTLGFFLLRTFGQGALSLVASNTLAMWFSRRLGLVSGVMGLGMSAAVAVLPSVYLRLIESFGWRRAYLILGGITVGLLVPLVFFFFKNCPEDIGQRVDGEGHAGEEAKGKASMAGGGARGLAERAFDLSSAWRTRAYWIGLVLHVIWGMIATAITFNIVPLFAWRGLSETQAAATFSTFAVCMALMQVIGGVLADRVKLNVLLAASAGGLFWGVVMVWRMATIWDGHLYAAIFGASQGLLIATGNTFWPRYFGRVHLGKIRSSVWTATVAGCSLGPFLLGFSFDHFQGYAPALGLFSGLLAGGFVAALFATPPRSA